MKMLTVLFWLMAGSGIAHAQSTVELVQSVPVETTLTVPGIAMTQDVWLALIQSATSTIDIEQYYINNVTGEALDPIISALKDAGARGVKIRFILDATFYAQNSTEAACLEGIQNLEIKQIDFSAMGGIMHAKYMVIDQSRLYVGSANFDWLALTQIHEVGMHIVDPAIAASLENTFNLDWNASTAKPLTSGSFAMLANWAGSIFNTKKPIAPTGGLAGFAVAASPTTDLASGTQDTLGTLTAMIALAKTSLNIQVYEYSTEGNARGSSWLVLDNAIRAAAKRGVQVQMLLDAVTLKNGGPALQALGKLPNITVKTVVIPEWSGGPLQYARLIHSKYMTVDHTYAWVGSENWIESYFTGTRNAGVATSSAALTAQLEQIFTQVWTSAYTTQQ